MEVKDILAYIGLEDVKDFDTFKSKYNEKHISRDMAVKDPEIKSAIVGATIGSTFQKAKRVFKEIGVEFEDGEVGKNDIDTLFEIGKTKVSSKLEELTASAPDVKTWQEKLAKVERKNADLSELLNGTKAELERVQTETATRVKQVKLDVAKKDIFGKIKFGETVSALTRKGFDSAMNERYKIDIDDETGAAIILDAKTNSRIKHPEKASEFADPVTIFTMEAEKEGLLAKVQNSSVNLQQSQRGDFKPAVNPDGVTRRFIKPANAKR